MTWRQELEAKGARVHFDGAPDFLQRMAALRRVMAIRGAAAKAGKALEGSRAEKTPEGPIAAGVRRGRVAT